MRRRPLASIAVFTGLLGVGLLPARGQKAPATPHTWRNVQIVGGGFVTGIVMHPHQKDLMYARTDIGGAYRWDPNVRRWIPLTDWVSARDWTLTGIESLALDPNDPKRVYLAAGTYTNDWSGNGALLRSGDQGRTWQRTSLPFKLGGNEDGRSNGERLAVDPRDGKTLFFGSRANGLWRSRDRGATWQPVLSFPLSATSAGARSGEGEWVRPVGIVFVQFVPSNGGRVGSPTQPIYAGVATQGTSLYRSRDGGTTWETVPGQPVGLRPNHAALAGDGNLYLSYGNEVGPNSVTDGAVWKLNTQTGVWTDVTPLKPSDGDRFGYGAVTVDARRPNVVMVSTMDRWAKKDDLFRTTDGGQTWQQLGSKAERDTTLAPWLTWGRGKAELGHWIGDLEIDPHNPNHVLYVTGTGIWTSDNATDADRDQPTRWTPGALGLEECVVADIASPSEGAHLLSAVYDIDGFRHDDLDRSPRAGFFQPAHGSNTSLDIAEQAPKIVARTFWTGTGGAYSTDGGTTWADFAAKPNDSRGGGTIAVSADGKTFLWTPDGGSPVYSRDNGATWTACTGLAPRLRVISDRADPSRFYSFDGGKVFTSTDGGASFTEGATILREGSGYLRATPGQPGHVWLASTEGLFRSLDGGKSFTKTMGATRGQRLGFGKAAPGKSYPSLYLVGTVGTQYGIYRSDNEGTTWTRINDDQHQFGNLNAITGDPRVWGRVYLASAHRGILYADAP